MARKKSYIREQVLEKALEVFWIKGYEGSHLQELVEVTGLNRFSLYKEFGGKGGLFDEVMNLYISKVNDFLHNLTDEPKGLETILAFFKAMDISFFTHGCFLINSLSEKYLINEKTYKSSLEWIQRYEDALDLNLKISLEKGEIKDGLSIESIRKFILAVDTGIIVMAINSPQEEIDKIVEMIEYFINSIKK